MFISFIIPNFNGKELLKKNLPKVLDAAKFYGVKYEIIVIDDNSTDDSVNFLKNNYPEIKIIIHKTNQRFAASCNNGVRKASGEVIVLLNTDVVPRKNFLSHLLKHFQDKNIFAVGCKEESILKGNKLVYSGRAQGKFAKGFLVHWRAPDQEKSNTLWVACGSGAFRKSIWEKLGGLDSLYYPAYWEDIDLSFRAIKSGFKILFEPQSAVFHQHETTNKLAFGRRGMKIAAYKNQILFVWKNITDTNLLASHLFWLPYHLVFTTISTRGLFLIGFIKALKQLPQAINSRNKVKRVFNFSDKEIFKNYA